MIALCLVGCEKTKDNNTHTQNSTTTAAITKFVQGEVPYEATEEETTQFLNNDFINLTDGYSAKSVKTPNRKRIALAMKTLSELEEDDRKNIFAYIKFLLYFCRYFFHRNMRFTSPKRR